MAAIANYFFPVNPVTERRELHLIPTELEVFVGEKSYAPLIQKSGGEVEKNHPKYREYSRLVQEVGAELAQHAKRPGLDFKFTLIDSDVDNAWCLPGGKIGINVGLIKKMEKEDIPGTTNLTLKEKIAAVLSHEIVHADARHTGRALEFRFLLIGIIKAAQIYLVFWVTQSYVDQITKARRANDRPLIIELTKARDNQAKRVGALFETLSSWLIEGLSLCNSRSHELESDRFGMRLIHDVAKAGTNGYGTESPKAAIWLQHFFAKHHSHRTKNKYIDAMMNLLSTHPSPEERLEANKKTWEDLQQGRLK